MKKLLLVLVVLFAAYSMTTSAMAQGGNRGTTGIDDASLEAAQRSVENQLMVEEMENAGFELDVEEGFDEEWEEEQWVGSEAEDVDPLHVDPSEVARFDLADVPEAEEIAAGWSEDSWENPEAVMESDATVTAEEDEVSEEYASDGAMRGEPSEDVEAYDADISADLEEDLLLDEAIETAELNWWEEEDSQWDEMIEDMDIDEYNEDFEEEEDLDLLEELYNRG
jgi:hypothetical protein